MHVKSISRLFPIFLLSSLLFPSLSVGDQVFSRENPIVRAVRKISPAVVNISTSKLVERGVNPFFFQENDDFFNRFFRDFFEPQKRQYVKNSLGSGVIIDSAHKYVMFPSKSGLLFLLPYQLLKFKWRTVVQCRV